MIKGLLDTWKITPDINLSVTSKVMDRPSQFPVVFLCWTFYYLFIATNVTWCTNTCNYHKTHPPLKKLSIINGPSLDDPLFPVKELSGSSSIKMLQLIIYPFLGSMNTWFRICAVDTADGCEMQYLIILVHVKYFYHGSRTTLRHQWLEDRLPA